jgi:hypothetical protein
MTMHATPFEEADNFEPLTERLHDIPLAEWTQEDFEEERKAWNDKIVSILGKGALTPA